MRRNSDHITQYFRVWGLCRRKESSDYSDETEFTFRQLNVPAYTDLRAHAESVLEKKGTDNVIVTEIEYQSRRQTNGGIRYRAIAPASERFITRENDLGDAKAIEVHYTHQANINGKPQTLSGTCFVNVWQVPPQPERKQYFLGRVRKAQPFLRNVEIIRLKPV